MSDGTQTPPGLEALANHLGFTFVKKQTSDNDSNGDSDETKVTSPKDEKPEEKSESVEKEEDKPKVPIGSLSSSVNIYHNKDDDTWTSKEPDDIESAEGEGTVGHALVLRLKKSKDSRKKYAIDSIVIQSPSLKTALGEILKDYPGVCCNLDRLVFQAPFEPFLHRWSEFVTYLKKADLDETTKSHMDLLHDVLRKELADTIKALEDYVSNGVVSFEHAWLVFQPDGVVAVQSQELIALKLKSGNYAETDKGNVYALNCQRVDWNGEAFGWATEFVELREFKGMKPINELEIFPLAFHPNKEQVELSLIERGKRFAALAGYHYRAYEGPAILRTPDGNVLIHNSGRIIIDTDSYCKQPGQCKVVTSPFASTGNGRRSSIDNGYWDSNDTYHSPLSSAENTELSLNKKPGAKPEDLTDFQHMLCTPLLRGYNISSKQWLAFYINNVKPIQWNTQAFNSLVLPERQKKMVLALSKTQAASSNTFDDIISGKGKGMILLLSGPPGVGKTLTAEAVSENLQVPLYMMSAGDLGVRPDEVEFNLEGTLKMVAKWRAILLIDECDVFLEARSAHDMERNKLVSIFLRLLEYYQGTLFLTTNRVDNIDPAFQSRIHIHLRYPDLQPSSRRQIWKSFLSRAPNSVSEEEIDKLAELSLNGRQIKNLVKTSQLVALEEEEALSIAHVELVMGIEDIKN
ncbi:ATPase [Dendryphion nanum]|uniref:ATPase n=1 Tax=Dendryphion nanum TaxID=256645 RepID=A0A9P9DZD9_9PLEO|nr:ATPase [Dendryphion nanum]